MASELTGGRSVVSVDRNLSLIFDCLHLATTAAHYSAAESTCRTHFQLDFLIHFRAQRLPQETHQVGLGLDLAVKVLILYA